MLLASPLVQGELQGKDQKKSRVAAERRGLGAAWHPMGTATRGDFSKRASQQTGRRYATKMQTGSCHMEAEGDRRPESSSGTILSNVYIGMRAMGSKYVYIAKGEMMR